jgi:ATP-binding cassette subfamily F protein uup
MADPALFSKDPDGFAARAKAHLKLKTEIEAMESEWLELELLREEIEGG